MTNPNAQNWRDIGDTTLECFKQELSRVDSPMLPDAEKIYNAASPHTALFLAISYVENKHATEGHIIKKEHHNPLGLTAKYGEKTIPWPDNPDFDNFFAWYDKWEDAVAAWKRRFDDPKMPYKDTTTLKEFLDKYAPAGHKHPVTGVDNEDIGYEGAAKIVLNRLHACEEAKGGTDVPNILDRWLHVGQTMLGTWYAGVNRRYIGRFGMKPKIIVLHIQQGNNAGSWIHFHSVSASATVLIGKNGDIWRLVPESDGPWTNGDVINPTALGGEIINKYGSDPNYYSLTIETEGNSGDVPPQAQLDSIIWQISTWMKTYDIPLRYVVRHADFNSSKVAAETRRYCPGDALYNKVIGLLSEDTTPGEPQYVQPDDVTSNGEPWVGKNNVSIGQAVFYGEPRTVTCGVSGLAVHQYADPASLLTRAALNKGDTFDVYGWVRGATVDGENRWWVTKTYSRVWVGGTEEKPGDSDPTDVPPTPTTNPVVLAGKEYYKSGRTIKVLRKANLRQWATKESAVVGVVMPDETYKVAYWCVGEETDGEPLWWILEPKQGDPIQNGARLWVAATDQRPS